MNSKNEYASNCLSRVTVEETKMERQLREREEELEEKKQEKMIESFRLKFKRRDKRRGESPADISLVNCMIFKHFFSTLYSVLFFFNIIVYQISYRYSAYCLSR